MTGQFAVKCPSGSFIDDAEMGSSQLGSQQDAGEEND